MNRLFFALICVTLILCNVTPILTKRTFGGGGRHSYPKSGGLSGGGSHGNSHGYPQSGGLSGNNHGYPSSGGSHSYPSSGGSHSYPSSGGSHSYPSSGGSHSYPSHGGMNHGQTNNNHQYPNGKGLSGNSPSSMGAGASHTTNIHHHYNYNPPQQIRYTPTHGGPPMNYPVYQHAPPSYVYQYKDSGSKYGTLLAGLALLNLGTLGVSAYALSKSHSNYKPQPGEVCKFGLRKENGDYEETRIDCQLITSFIFQEEAKTQSGGSNTTVVTTVTNVTMVNTTSGSEPAASMQMLPNGTLVPLNSTVNNATANNATSQPDGQMTSSVTITTTNTTTVTNALDVKGKAIDVTSGMKCYVLRHTPSSNMKKSVPCGLLQSYAQQSLKRNSASRNMPVMVVFSAVLAVLMAFIISACWVAGAVVGLLPLFGWYSAEDSEPGCYFVEVMDYNYLLFLYFATIVTPSVLLAAFYAHIYRVVVKQMSAVVTVEGGQGQRGTMLRVLGAAQKREVKATQNLAIIVFFFIVCWIPLYTMNAIKAFKPELDIPNPLTYFCIIFSHLNSAINPLLYAYHLKDFRSALKGLILTIFGRGVPLPAAYRPPVPIRRPALERCNALRERPRVYVNSPVWLRQREAEMAANEEKTKASRNLGNPDLEPFLNKVTKDGSSGRHTPDGKEGNNGPYLIQPSQSCQSPYKKVEEFIRRVRSVSSDNS